MKKLIGAILKYICYYSHLSRVIAYYQRHQVVIFMVHGVASGNVRSGWKPLQERISVNEFERILKFLNKRYNFVTMEEAVSILSHEKEGNYTAVLTFDDGYRNHHDVVAPILEQYTIPGVFYVTTHQTESAEPFWFDRLDYAFQRLSKEVHEITVDDAKISLDCSSRENLTHDYRRFRRIVKGLPARNGLQLLRFIENLSQSLEDQFSVDIVTLFKGDELTGVMDWNDVRDLNNRGHEIGSHSRDHVLLNTIDSSEIREQINQSYQAILQNVGPSSLSFCYPNGNYSDEVIRQVASCGYTSAVTTIPGFNSKGCDLFQLKRYSYPERYDPVEISNKLSGLGFAFAWIKQQLGRPSW